MKNKLLKKAISLLLCLVLVLSYLPAGMLKSVDASQATLIIGDKKADPSSIIWEDFFGPDKMDTEFAGAVWTDKSVFTGTTNELPGVTLNNNNNFLVALSSIAANVSVAGHTSLPTDTMLVLDMSGSMVDGSYEVGYIRTQQGNYREANGIDMSLINAMIDATNATIDKLMSQNGNNRVGVVLYSGNTSQYSDATTDSATVVLPLGRYNGVNGKYLSVDANYVTNALYERSWSGGWRATGESATYVPTGNDVDVSVANGLTTEAGTAVTDASKEAVGGTYIQNGLYQAMNQLLAADTTVPEGIPQAGTERMPVIVLMTDGAPTIATTDYNNVGTSNTGNGTSSTDRITFLTQLTAAYVRGKVAEHYKENERDESSVLFMTLGLGTENSSAATDTLYPSGSNNTLKSYWTKYLAGTAGSDVSIISGDNGLTLTRDAAVAAMNYVDKYFYASDANSLITSFGQILGEIELKSEAYTTLVEGGNANYSGYVTFEDELGELMQVHDMKGILMSDGNGGTVLYTGKGVAKSLNEGILGTVDGPTERGDELVRTVKERIPGLTTTQAQQLISYAYLDGQLYYTDENNWSNYIGWYADANGNFAGFWDKDSGYENAPANAVYANRSYGYLGAHEDTDMMHVVVMVRTELSTLHQTVYFKVPASLLPTVQYKVTLNKDDPTLVDEFVREDAVPMQLVFEVGLRSDINSVNLEQKIKEHIAKGGHVHRNDDGSVTFYTNEWAIGNDTNQNGIPDPDEVDNAKVTDAHFHPALDNTRYYYTEDTTILDASGNPVTDPNAVLSGTYHIDHYYYNQTRRVSTQRAIAAETLAKAEYVDGRWVIPQGTMFRELTRLRVQKDPNTTGTLDYSRFSATFEAVGKQDVYSFLGNNGSFTVTPASGITLRKEIQGTIADATEYTFAVTLSNIPAGAVAAPVLTDANGDALTGVTMSAFANNSFTVTLPADVTAYISGIPVGTTVTVAERIAGDYKVVGITVAGQNQTAAGNATAAVPAFVKDANEMTSAVSQMVPVVFTNAPNGYGDLVISKDIIHNLESDPAAMANKAFTFHLTLSGDRITEGMTFDTAIPGTKVKVGAGGVVTYADGSAIVLKNEESVTIKNLPEGTVYKVTETNLPGFVLDNIGGNQGAVEATGTIVHNTESLADFYNRYSDDFTPVTVPVTLDITKVLTVISGTPDAEEFVFVLQMLRPDGTYPSIADANGQKYLKVGANASGQAAFNLTFDDLGTYFFRVVELKPSEQSPAGTDTSGMNYSTMQALFEVVVTDEDMDGVLEINFREEAHVSVTPGTNNSYTVAATFENVYEVGSTATTVNVHKELKNPAGANIPLTEFQFSMIPCDANGNPLAGAAATEVYTSAKGDATFNIRFNDDGEHYFLITEKSPANPRVGMTYDTTAYIFKAVVEKQTVGTETEYVVTQRELKIKGTTTVIDPVDGVYTARFENKYELTADSVTLPIFKELTGRNPAGGEQYETYLVRTDGYFNPLTGPDAWNASYFISANASGLVVKLDFDKVGTYHYKWTEVIPNGAVLDPATGKYVLNGVTYDTSVYHITVTVSDNGSGALEAVTVIHKLGEIAPVTQVKFVNNFVVTGTDDVTIGGKKILEDRQLIAGEFTIGLYSDPDCRNQIATAANRADGTFSFPTITYTSADLGEGSTAKTYTYYIKEIIPADAVLNPTTGKYARNGVTYSDEKLSVTVTVKHENGVLVAVLTQNATVLEITNSYLAESVDVPLKGNKVLSGDWTNVPNKTFRFDLFEANASFAVTNQTPVKTEFVDGAEDFTMTLSYADGEEGFHYYVLKETITTRAGGIGYDAGEYHITVNVTDPGEGKLSALVTIYRPGTGNTDKATFTNVYTVAPTTVTLEGTKTFINTTTNRPMPMEGGEFQFVVLEGAVLEQAKVVSTGTNKADGTIEFTPIRYTAAGVHTYTVVEDTGNAGGVIYSQAKFTVTVTVTDNGNGTLATAVNYNGTPVAFENKYTPGAAQVILSGKKEFSGNWTAVANKVFNFELFETDSTFAVTGEAKAVTSNQEDGTFSFGTLTYAAAGTHYYVIREENYGETLNGVTYSAKEIHVTVDVVDNGTGLLIPTVTTTDTAATVTQDSNRVTVDGMVFTNEYKASAATYTPTAKKHYAGGEMKTFDFVLSVDGTKKQTKSNDADGNVAFDQLTFSEAGVYELTIQEQKNALLGLIRWDTNIYTVTLHVEDDGKGKLFVNDSKTTVESENSRVDLVFQNAHHDVITDKDVFSAAEPTVSIDGKAVKVGDVLLYKISYTNFAGKPVDITITDSIPQNTEYVAGSADNGGALADGILTWNLKEVAAGDTVTVSFKVKVTTSAAAVTNTAEVREGENTYKTNAVTTAITVPSNPQTGDTTPVALLVVLMLIGVVGILVLLLLNKKRPR